MKSSLFQLIVLVFLACNLFCFILTALIVYTEQLCFCSNVSKTSVTPTSGSSKKPILSLCS